ncbi:MAG: DUF2007 domain-containing protein [Candidatus Omnitrophica bacterium]|nr:DUF2007 domain-containing protein [Candidatus Omnitrophota bacterium]MCG2705845.1 DUF2007 domain-containing protein [Candidatus Omnitrophota bacterium]
MKEYIKFKELLQTYNMADIAFIKSLLDASKIEYYVQGDNFLAVRPFVQAARIMVDNEKYNEAKELLKDYKGKFTSFS